MKRAGIEAGSKKPNDDNTAPRSQPLVVVAAIVAVVLLLLIIQVMPVPNSTKLYRSLVDFGHAPVFAAIAFASLQMSRAARGFADNHPDRRDYIVAVGAVVALAFLSELAQVNESGRSASLLDVLRDIAGGTLCLSLYGFSRAPEELKSRTHRRLITAMSTVLVAFLIAPVAWTIAAYVNRDAKWPTIMSIESRLDWVLLHPFESEIRKVRDLDLAGGKEDTSGLLVTPREFADSGLTVEDLSGKWSEYRAVCTDIANLNDVSIQAMIRLGDAPNIFRSKSFLEFDLFLPPLSRVTTCSAIVPTQSKSPNGYRTNTGYSSLSLMTPASENARSFIVHRIWLE